MILPHLRLWNLHSGDARHGRGRRHHPVRTERRGTRRPDDGRPLRRPETGNRRGRQHPARARLDPLRRADQGAGRRHDDRRPRLPRRHPVRARGAAGRQRDEGRHGDPQAAAGRDRRAADGQDGDRHRQGRHPRHRQEPGRHDDGGCRLRGRRPRHQQPGREIPRYRRGRRGRHHRHVGAADHHHALHEGGDRHAERARHARGLHHPGRRRAAERGIRPGGSAPTPIAATPRWRSRRPKTLVARKHNQGAARV